MSDKTNPEVSALHFYSIGRAANNKALKNENGHPETKLEVTPIEQLNMLDGELISLPFDSEVNGKKADGSSYSAKVTLNTALTATWLSMSANRSTPPDVRRGERVIIWRYKDTDQYYWTETNWDQHLRRLETMHLRFSATADEQADMEDARNYYHLAISTHEGMIHLETARANGEKAKYALQINTKDGLVVLTDDFGNFWQIESIAKIVSMQNGDGTLLQLDKKKLYGYASQSIHLIAEENMRLETKDFKLTTQTGRIDASSRFTINTPQLNVGGGQATFEVPVTFQEHIQANGIRSSAPIVGPSDTI
jgi:hypothetical protein